MWTTDTFLQNLARFSALKGQDRDVPTAVWKSPRPSGRTHGRMDGPTAVGKDPLSYYETGGGGGATLMGATEVTSEAKGWRE